MHIQTCIHTYTYIHTCINTYLNKYTCAHTQCTISVQNVLLKIMYAMVVWHCRAGDGGQWMTDGCQSDSNQTHTTCSCNHLTSFAVIMSPTSPNVITQTDSVPIENVLLQFFTWFNV